MPKPESDIRFTSGNIEFRDAETTSDPGILGTLHGYAAVFNSPTLIQSEREGTFTEIIAPGAFAKTLRERGDRVKVLFNHGFDPWIGDKPLGKPSVIQEDAKGLYVEVPLVDTSYNRDLIALVKAGAIDGQSFRFQAISDSWDRKIKPNVRTLKEIRLHEFGPVVFPAYEAATIAARHRQRFLTSERILTATAAQARLRLLERKKS